MPFGFRKNRKDGAPAENAASLAGVPVSELTPRGRAALSALSAENSALKSTVERLQTQLADSQALADLDPLIPIFNRRAFERELARSLDYAERYGFQASFIYMDLDGFKQINDRFGHSAGDSALLHVGRLLLANVRESDIVGRLGGDEFGIILAKADLIQARAKADALARIIADTPASFEERTLLLGASCGAYSFGPGDSANAIIARADEAMYAEKAARKAAAAARREA